MLVAAHFLYDTESDIVKFIPSPLGPLNTLAHILEFLLFSWETKDKMHEVSQ